MATYDLKSGSNKKMYIEIQNIHTHALQNAMQK